MKHTKTQYLLNKKSDRQLFTMCIPAIIKLFIFSYLPMVGIIMAFQNFMPRKGIWGSEFVGLDNFKFFFKSNDWVRITSNTIIMNLIFIATGLVFSILIALLMYEITSKAYLKVMQTMMFFPYFISWTLVGLILLMFLNSNGIITVAFKSITGESINFYSNPDCWKLILTIVNIWKGAGISAIIYYANMMSIDKEYYEAAKIDGANKFQEAWYITLPQIKTMVIVLTVMAMGNIIRADFGIFYFVPRNSAMLYSATDVIDTYVYRAVSQLGDFSMASAVGLFQSVIGFFLIIITNTIVRKVNKNAALF